MDLTLGHSVAMMEPAMPILTPEERRRDLMERMKVASIDQTDLAKEWGISRAAVSQKLQKRMTMDLFNEFIDAMRSVHQKRGKAFD
jgi:hypothetical protein